MPSATPKPTQRLALALEAARADYASANPKSHDIHANSTANLPGGTTRNVIHFNPFPIVFTSGNASHLTSADNEAYLDLCGEYSASLFGHSHPVITSAMITAINSGFALGGVNQYEGRLAKLFCQRYKSIEKIRFSNSGTEANMTALALVKAYTKRETIIVFKGGYHGGLASFGKDEKIKANTMNAPHKWVVLPYNDEAALRTAVQEHRGDLACIFLELMQGSSGCLPADAAFVEATRELATETGAVLMFDEVMTSRMAAGGMQSLFRVTPDMTTLGKYLAGGGQNFGAFGGRREIMDLIEPGYPGGVYHSGTYNNNVTTMAAGVAVLEEVWTEEVADSLFATGEWLRRKLQAVAEEAESIVKVTGVGSLMSIHFSLKEVKTIVDVNESVAELKELFFFDMLRKGFFLAQRGMISVMTITQKEELDSFVEAVREFLEERKDFVCIQK